MSVSHGVRAGSASTAVSFEHLFLLGDEGGPLGGAVPTGPSGEPGSSVDDVARALVVAARQQERTTELDTLASTCLTFVTDAQAEGGAFRNRRSADGSWCDEPTTGDAWGRALWALGTAMARVPDTGDGTAQSAFAQGAALRSPSTRSMAFAGLGAAEVLEVRPRDVVARTLLSDAATLIAPPDQPMGMKAVLVDGWHWPEPRLSYANAALAETLLAAGSQLGVWKWFTEGLAMLSWLLETETADGHVSVCPSSGWGQGEVRPVFDQDPADVAALADACARAFDVTADARWSAAVGRCAAWFEGANAADEVLHDRVSGGCGGPGEGDRGAGSTIAMISTFQQARRLGVTPARRG